MNLKTILGIGLVGASAFPVTSGGFNDRINIQNDMGGRSHEGKFAHHSQATEGYVSGEDVDYGKPLPWVGEWGPKITTMVDGHELEADLRPTNSISIFHAALGAFIDNGSNLNFADTLYVSSTSNTTYKAFDPIRIYVGKAQILSNYTASGQEFTEIKNLRDVAPTANVYGSWSLTTLNILGSQTNSQGVVNYGTLVVSVFFLDTDNGHNSITGITRTGSGVSLATSAQLGVYLVDTVQANTNLLQITGWADLRSFTNYILPTVETFDAGWKSISRDVDVSSYSNSPSLFLRIRRTLGTTNFLNGASFPPL
jgi:hypothetical protein